MKFGLGDLIRFPIARVLVLAVLFVACTEEDPSEPADIVEDVEEPFKLNASDVLFLDSNIPGLDISLPPQCATDEQCLIEGEDSQCQKRICHPTEKSCVSININEGKACTVENACVTSTVCVGGVCVPENREANVTCDDDNFCTNDTCDPEIGCIFSPLDSGICDDYDPCTKDDYCDDGICIPGVDICPAQCGDGLCQTEKQETCGSCELDCGACSTGCDASPFAGCAGCGCEACVCDQKPDCCSTEWTAECAILCTDNCGTTQDGCSPSPIAECCGCGCESCVCQKDPSCCSDAWGPACVSLCALECDGPCSDFCGDGVCADDGETCESCPEDCGVCSDGCSLSATAGCNGCDCEACVCELAPTCCENTWSELCVAACASECGGNCAPSP